MHPDPQRFAQEWVASWNSHDLDRILAHYAEDVVITSPMIQLAAGGKEFALRGKADVRAYWAKALAKFPSLHFELFDVAAGVDSIAVYYRSILGRNAIEVMHFDKDGQVVRMYAHYTEPN